MRPSSSASGAPWLVDDRRCRRPGKDEACRPGSAAWSSSRSQLRRRSFCGSTAACSRWAWGPGRSGRPWRAPRVVTRRLCARRLLPIRCAARSRPGARAGASSRRRSRTTAARRHRRWTPTSSQQTSARSRRTRRPTPRARGRKDGPNESYLLALEPKTGRVVEHIRPAKQRLNRKKLTSTPIPFTARGPTEILISGGDCLTGHDVKTGHQLCVGVRGTEQDWALAARAITSGFGTPEHWSARPKVPPIFAVKHRALRENWI